MRYASIHSSFFAAFFISLCMYLSVIKLKEINNKYNRIFKIVIFAIPIFLSTILLLLDDYGASKYVCGFKNGQVLMVFNIPLFITTFINFILIYKVIKYFNSIQLDDSDEGLTIFSKDA